MGTAQAYGDSRRPSYASEKRALFPDERLAWDRKLYVDGSHLGVYDFKGV
jgi:hypothetical protein